MQSLWYGGDYNPDQWPREVWDEDVRLMRRAGVTVVTVGVFSWAKLEPTDGTFEFAWLDDVLDLLHRAGIRVDLATATASPPAWLVMAHPDVLPVTESGVRLGFGSRQHYNPSSATYRRYATRLVRMLAERYGSHPALQAWHVNNEYGCHVSRDYSAESARAFREWLASRYGSVARLNEAWGTAFWSQAYGTFAEVEPPRAAPTFLNPMHLIDFDRFSSDALLECFLMEAEILREVTPGVPLTTNFMGFFKPLDYWLWAPHLDFISDDHYPDPADPAAAPYAAMMGDLMRSLGSGRPWILMEQAPSAVNWRVQNAAKPAGMHRRLSLQAVARGADGIMQFQWRQSAVGSEKFHSGMVPHAGQDSRVFRETVALGAELASLADLRGARLAAQVAILFDWPSWWAVEQDAVPARLSYLEIVSRWYRELWGRGVLVDFVAPEAALDDYALVIAPATAVLSTKARESLSAHVASGGHLVVGYQTAILDPDLHVIGDGYLGELQTTLGLWIEEFAPPAAGSLSGTPRPDLRLDGLAAGPASEWGEVVRVTSADVRATFVGGMLHGQPAITHNTAGAGTAWYVATAPIHLGEVVEAVLTDAGLDFGNLPENVEVVTRGTKIFVLNHGAVSVEIEIEGQSTRVEAGDVLVLTRSEGDQ